MKAKYVNPFTGFGFKKIFGEEASKPLLLDFLNALLPGNSQVEQAFEKSELAQLDTVQCEDYERSLKEYRDMKGYMDTAYDEGRTEGILKGEVDIARSMKAEGEAMEKIAKYTGLSKAEIEKL